MKVLSQVENCNGQKVLMVDGKPFIMLAGEVHNSNSSSVAYMEGVYDQADALGMNCLLLPMTWELVEPEEGVFDFSLMDGLIMQARARGKKLAFLWFGAWKNAKCYYAPAWVKTDTERFRRAQIQRGRSHQPAVSGTDAFEGEVVCLRVKRIKMRKKRMNLLWNC